MCSQPVLKLPVLKLPLLLPPSPTSQHDVLKLAKLEHLQKLTLHGNPVSEHKNYK